MLIYRVSLCAYDDETDSDIELCSVDGSKEDIHNAYTNAVACLNSVECNHDQTDRTEGSL